MRITAGVLRLIASLLMAAVLLSYSIPTASAMCPLCTAGAAIGLGIARYYGVDDTIVGIWLGALAVSTALWINRIVKKRVKVSTGLQALVIAAVIVSTVLPFYFAGFFNGMPTMANTILGVNRLVFGVVLGGAISFIGAPVSNHIKRRRNAAVPYQSILLTLGLLVAASLLLWLITKNYYVV